MLNESILYRPEFNFILPANHGAFDYAELERLGLNPNAVLDFSVNSNPFGPSPQVKAALDSVPLERYPDREALALRRALGERLNLAPEQIVAGNGTAELLWLIAFACLTSGSRVLILGPTFGEYQRVSALMGARVTTCLAQPDDFVMPVAAVATQLRQQPPQLVFICNPNNPTGQTLAPETLTTWADSCPTTLFVVDESYLNFVPGLVSVLAAKRANILVVRSMTKDYALAGLRLGYAAGHNAALIAAIAAVRPAWNVSALAQVAGLAALQDTAHLQQSLAALAQAKTELVTQLMALHLPPLPSATHYFLLNVGHADALRRRLLEQSILVRDCASFGLPNHVRIATRRPEENRRLIAALEKRGT